MAKHKRDYYEILGVTRSSDAAELKRSYRTLALRYHPDQNQNDKGAEEKFKEVSEAYAVLSDSEKRLRYDRLGHVGLSTNVAGIDTLGLDIDGKIVTYYLLFVVVLALLLALLRIVNSPFGRVLQAIRENDFRAEAIGYRTVVWRTLASVLSALFATLAGCLLALWLRYQGPDTSLSFEIMLDILLVVVIGGMGTVYGAVIGSVLFVIAQNYLQDLLKLGASALEGVPVLAALVSPDRWLLWLGVLFVLSVYHFPTGVVGRLRALALRQRR